MHIGVLAHFKALAANFHAIHAIDSRPRSPAPSLPRGFPLAESCARTCVRLSDMNRLLEDLALEKVKQGDEAGAKQVLQVRRGSRLACAGGRCGLWS